MALRTLIQTSGSGGIAADSKTGLPNSSKFQRFLDIFSDSDSIQLHPRAVKDSGSTVVDMIRWFVEGQPFTSKMYGYGSLGHIYSEDAGTWTDLKDVGTSQGQGMAILNDILYYANANTLGKYGYLSGTPTFSDAFLENGVDNLDQSLDTSGNTYTLATSIAETATHRQSFTPTKVPLSSIEVLVAAKGTGNWTLTVHDEDNNVMGVDTILNANVTVGDTEFFPTIAADLNIGQEYHFHLTSTVADGTVTTTSSNDLETVDFHTYFGILFSHDYHPMILHTDGTRGMIAIGNKNFIATYNGLTYQPNKIQIPPGFNIRGWTKEDEYIVAYCWKGTTVDDLADSEEGLRVYWDGISPYYNFTLPITGGMDNAVVNYKNRMFSINGYRGELNLSNSQSSLNKIQDLQTVAGEKVEVAPGAICVWQDRVHFGVANSTTGDTEPGIYEYGNRSDRSVGGNEAVEVLNYAYKVSSDAGSDELEIGALIARGEKLYVSWAEYGAIPTVYGVDKITIGGNPSTSGGWESLILDLGGVGKELKSMPHKEKAAQEIIVSFKALPADATITPKYQINRSGSWVTGTAATEGATEAKLVINKRYKEIQIGYDIVATTNNVLITSVVFLFDDLSEEEPR